jgi:hypothetical protein
MSENNVGSLPRSSPGIYKTATKVQSMFSPNKSANNRLLSVPAASIENATIAAAATVTAAEGISLWRYLLIFLILMVLAGNLVLFLIKPADKSITHLYDPLINLYKTHFTNGKNNQPIVASVSKKNNDAAVNKLEKALDENKVRNNIDGQKVNLEPEPVKKYKKLPVIPETDDATSRIQMNPKSKSGFCYIGEDRGFRNCIEVGGGDVCMSGDIFPTEAICINPNLRE